ncbi:MAG TPA: MogA/MoaB family molybdenum cofactor biosynthesis protein [Tepidisphaeraceae bacterium]|nr:MogA/MoaB family molybdenum cofactor biosynthesis protein [Tepidisphaeraceae bacterium]
MGYEEHHRKAEGIIVRCAVITLSDTRNESNDTSGKLIRDLLTQSGHTIASYQVLRDEPAELEAAVSTLLESDQVDAILTNGGTGISKRDQTISAIEKHLDIELPGFGELFRMLSWEQIASGAMLSRAIGGIAKGKLIFAMPGSTQAVELAMTQLILPELKHLTRELRK